MKRLATLLSIVGQYLGYWIGRSIYLSFLDSSATIETIAKTEWIIAGAVCGLICLTNYLIYDTSSEFVGIILVVVTAIAINVPFSIGFVALFNLTIIGCILVSIWKK